MAFDILTPQPRDTSGPFTQAELRTLKAKQPGHQHHIHKPWKTGITYPYASTRQRERGLRRISA